MQSDSAANAPGFNPERLRTLTQRFAALRQGGLNSVAFGILGFTVEVWDLPQWWLKALFPMLSVPLLLCFTREYIPKYYERRFGHIESRSLSSKESVQFLALVVFFVGFVIVGSIMGARADALLATISNQLHVAISDPEHRINLNPVLYFLLWLMLYVSSFLSRPQAATRSYAIIVAPLPWALLALCPLRYPMVSQFLLWKVLTTGWLGLTFVTIGIHEHIRLVRMFPRRIDDSNH